jgi:PKD repeat protein
MTERGLVRTARRHHPAHLARCLGLTAAVAAALLGVLVAPAARAIVVQQGGRGYGVTPLRGVPATSIAGAYRAPAARVRPFDGAPEGGGPLLYRGGPVMHHVTTHIIYWDPTKQFTTVTKTIFAGFFNAVAADSGKASNVFAVAGQYTDHTANAAYSSTFGGEATDEDAYPASGCTVPSGAFIDKGPPYTHCLLDSQLQTELAGYIATHELPTGSAQQYFLLLPHTVVTCLKTEECSNNVFCAYHSAINPGTGGEIIYSDIPFSLLDSANAKGCQDDGHLGQLQNPNGDTAGTDSNTRFADFALKYTSHEYIEAATDPLVTVNTSLAWVDENGLEIGDKCNGVSPDEAKDGIGYDANSFTPTLGGSAALGTLFNQEIGGHDYYLQSEWDNAARACRMQPAPITNAQFTAAPAAPAAATPVFFQATSNDIYAGTTYFWTFGDGSVANGAAPIHAFARPGAYQVTMTASDALTGVAAAPVTQTVTISEPAGPAPAAPVATAAAQTTSPPAAAAPSAAPGQANVQALAASFNARSGAVTLTGTAGSAGAVAFLATFPNGSFGAFAASGHACRAGQVRLSGACRPARVVFARGSMPTLGGPFKLVLRPSSSALRALRAAFRRRRPLPVTIRLTFEPSQGGASSSQTRLVAVRLKHG